MAIKKPKPRSDQSTSHTATADAPEFPPEMVAFVERIARRMHDLGIPEDLERESRGSSRTKALSDDR